jgi:ParB-like chromosome segregation protein Spo0J
MDGTRMSMYSPPQLMELSKIDPRFSSLRLAEPEDLRRLQQAIQSDGGIRDPLLVSTGVEPEHWVLVDGFKRLSVALEMGSTHLWVLTAQLDAAHAKAAIMHCNQPREGLCALEEAWLVRSLCDQGIPRKDVAQLLRRDEPWVSRRMKIATNLEKSLQDDVKQGLLSTAAACNLSQLQRDNQRAVAQAVRDCQFSSREVSRLVQRLRKGPRDEKQAVHEMLQDPWGYIDAAETQTKHADDRDSALSEAGNRLRRTLLRYSNVSGQLTHKLRRADPADARILAPLVEDAAVAGKQAQEQLEATSRSCSQPQPTQGEQASTSGSQPPSAHA